MIILNNSYLRVRVCQWIDFLQSIFNLLRICCRSFDAAKCICRHTVWNESVPRESELTWKSLSKVADEFPYTLSRAWKFLNITCWQPNWVSSYLPVWIWDRDDHVPFQWTCIRLSTWDNELTCRANTEQSSRNIGEWRWGGGGGTGLLSLFKRANLATVFFKLIY